MTRVPPPRTAGPRARGPVAAGLALLLAGCGGDLLAGDPPDGGPGDAPDLAPAEPPWDPQAPAICGQAPYQWLPARDVGAVLESARKPNVSLLELQLITTVAYLGSRLNVKHGLSYGVRLAVLRYQTQDRGKTVDATATVAWPAASNRRFPLALFLHPTLGYTDRCAPSRDAGKTTAPMTIFAMLLASQGYVAVLPDYLNQRSLGGPSPGVTPYLLLEPTAIASLDAARAAKAYLAKNETVTAAEDLYLWGHSQGGQAVAFTLALQPFYAPELAIKAAASLSPPLDLLETGRANWAGPEPLYNLGQAQAYAWRDYYGGVDLRSALLPPWDATALLQLDSYCDPSYKDPIRQVKDPGTIFTPPFLALLRDGAPHQPWSCWLRANNPATMGPPPRTDVPLLYVTGEKDVTVPPPANQAVVDRWCGAGAKIVELQCAGADHTASLVNSIDDVLSFFEDRQAGKALPADLCRPRAPVRCTSTP